MISRNLLNVTNLSIENDDHQLNEIYLITDENGDVIYKKKDSSHDGIIMTYKDSSKQSGRNYVEYSIDLTTQNLKVTDSFYPYLIIAPYSDTITDKNDILSFTDTTYQISCLDEMCFYQCNSLTSLSFPGVTDGKQYSTCDLRNLQYANLSSLTSFSAGAFGSNALKKLYINSSVYKSISNGFGEDDQVISNYIENKPVYVVSKITRLSNDNTIEADSFAFAYTSTLSVAYLKNLKTFDNFSLLFFL